MINVIGTNYWEIIRFAGSEYIWSHKKLDWKYCSFLNKKQGKV